MLSLFFDNLLEEPFKKGKKLVNFKRAYHHDMGKVVIVPLSFSSSKFQSKKFCKFRIVLSYDNTLRSIQVLPSPDEKPSEINHFLLSPTRDKGHLWNISKLSKVCV